MKILLRYCRLNARAVWRGLVESQINKLQGLAGIASARVTLERQQEFAPAFRVEAQLEVPGPDFHAEARDHTLPAALLKVVKDLERQIRSRRSRRAGRWKTNLRVGLIPDQGAMRLAAKRERLMGVHQGYQ